MRSDGDRTSSTSAVVTSLPASWMRQCVPTESCSAMPITFRNVMTSSRVSPGRIHSPFGTSTCPIKSDDCRARQNCGLADKVP